MTPHRSNPAHGTGGRGAPRGDGVTDHTIQGFNELGGDVCGPTRGGTGRGGGNIPETGVSPRRPLLGSLDPEEPHSSTPTRPRQLQNTAARSAPIVHS